MYTAHSSYPTGYVDHSSSSRRSARPAELRYDDRAFPGPLHIPAEPRLYPNHSPSSSAYSSDSLHDGYRERREKLPPITALTSTLGSWPNGAIDPRSHRSTSYVSSPASPSFPPVHSLHPHHSHYPYPDAVPTSVPKKFGARQGSRFICTYVSPVTKQGCAIWDQGWTVYATLNRHAETEHAPEEIELIKAGRLSFSQAQIVTSREKLERLEEQLETTGRCPDCGTVFSSGRKDSLVRHKQTSACEKAQKRGRPPTKFPKKPKGQGYHLMDGDSEDGY